MNTLRHFILHNCMTVKNGLNNRTTKEDWWRSRGHDDIYRQIFDETAFLGECSFAERLYCVVHNVTEKKTCQVCNQKNVGFQGFGKGYRDYCSLYCATQSPVRNQKIANGLDYSLIHQKVRKTNLERYGVETGFQLETVKAKSKRTKLERYGNENYVNKEKAVRTNLERYGVEHSFQKFIRPKRPAPKSFPPEFDFKIWIPSKKVGIELNGLYWHSYDHEPTKTERERHWIKCQMANKKGIRLIQIWEDEWREKKSIVLDIINRACKEKIKSIYGRNTAIRDVDTKDARTFLEQNHIQGYAKCSVRLGLYHKNRLVAIMTFGRSRFHKEPVWELIRFASQIGYRVIGGERKLFKRFIDDYKPDRIISYCDTRLFQGRMYSTLGFNKHNHTIDYFWTRNGVRYNRYQTQKKRLETFLGVSSLDRSLSEHQIMTQNGFRKLYGSGHDTWIWFPS